MHRTNALSPDQMTPAQRRAELCGLIALGLLRMRARAAEFAQRSEPNGESCLHYPQNQCLHANQTHGRRA
jgi:hypothetical protein